MSLHDTWRRCAGSPAMCGRHRVSPLGPPAIPDRRQQQAFICTPLQPSLRKSCRNDEADGQILHWRASVSHQSIHRRRQREFYLAATDTLCII